MSMPADHARTARSIGGGSAPLGGPAAVQQHDPAAARLVRNELLRQLLRDPHQALAPRHLVPDFPRSDPSLGPKHDEIVEQVGALADHRLALAATKRLVWGGLGSGVEERLAEEARVVSEMCQLIQAWERANDD